VTPPEQVSRLGIVEKKRQLESEVMNTREELEALESDIEVTDADVDETREGAITTALSAVSVEKTAPKTISAPPFWMIGIPVGINDVAAAAIPASPASASPSAPSVPMATITH
jgi:hypothetical protein